MQEANGQKELIVKRISASQFEVCERSASPVRRQSVIRRAPPVVRTTEVKEAPPAKKGKKEIASHTGVILIKDAIMYRVVDILMWKVVGEGRLRELGYPTATTSQLLWRLVSRSLQDHDCGGDVSCFSSHVFQLLEISAPELRAKPGRGKLPAEELLRRIYHEDLVPYLRSVDLRTGAAVLQCHSDIILLEKWEQQRFTAVTWSGQKHLARVAVDLPKCPRCSNRHF